MRLKNIWGFLGNNRLTEHFNYTFIIEQPGSRQGLLFFSWLCLGTVASKGLPLFSYQSMIIKSFIFHLDIYFLCEPTKFHIQARSLTKIIAENIVYLPWLICKIICLNWNRDFFVRLSETNLAMSSFKTFVISIFKHVFFLAELSLWQNPAPELHQILFEFYWYQILNRTVVICH